MDRIDSFKKRILNLKENPDGFNQLAMDIFQYQANENPVYRKFLELVGCEPFEVETLEAIPFLPISLFKTKTIQTGEWKPETLFQSSGTTGQTRSKHWVRNVEWYHTISKQIFTEQIINPKEVNILGLLPTYLENPNSSLISMVSAFGKESGLEVVMSGLDFDEFRQNLEDARTSGRKILIFSVTYALLRLCTKTGFDLSDCMVIETGGMKGLEVELPKEAILEKIRNELNVKQLYSEYGMTEMLSQAYSDGIIYKPGFSMCVMIREVEDPLGNSKVEGRGALNIIDLANVSTCSFIATDDLGRRYPDGSFEVYGRIDGSEIRGCNLLFT